MKAREILASALAEISAEISLAQRWSAAPRPLANGLGFRSRATPDPTRYLRRGLAITIFNALEQYVVVRSEEIAAILESDKRGTRGWTHVSNDNSTIDLEAKMTSATLRNLDRDRIQTHLDRTLLDSVARGIATTPRGTYVSPMAFRWNGANLSADALGSALSSLGCEKPWAQIEVTAGHFGLQKTRERMINLAKQRHRAAHDFAEQVAGIQLTAAVRDALAIAATYDTLSEIYARRLARISAGKAGGACTNISTQIRVEHADQLGATFRLRSSAASSRSLAKLARDAHAAAQETPNAPLLAIGWSGNGIVGWEIAPKSLEDLA